MIGSILIGLVCCKLVYNVQGWQTDPEFEAITDGKCDFEVYNAASLGNISLGIERPYIIRGLVSDWPAFWNWKKVRFIELYGSNVIRTGSESSIVHSGGVAENETSLADLINTMSAERDQVYGDSFLFDTTVLKAIPELKDDFTVPPIFAAWDNADTEERAQLWHMLSLGPSRSGLPFHNHGKTWLAVVHGTKQWFLYPPGYDPPRIVDETFNPMFPVSNWLEDVYDRIKSRPKPPLGNLPEGSDAGKAETEEDKGGYRPVECRQNAGDLLFLPARWTHLTVNIGETIAIGGQETLYDQDRLNGARSALKLNNQNYDAWKDLGLAQFNMAHQKLSAVRGMIKEYTPNGPLILRDLSSLDDLLERTGDTWVVLYFDSSVFAASNVNEESAAAFRNIKTQWAALSVLARDTYNVAALDIAGKYTVQPLEDQLREEDLRAVKLNRTLIRFHKVTTASMYRVDDFHTFIALPTMKLHRGKVSQLVQDEDFDADIEGLDYDGDLGNVEFINELVVREMEADVLAPGSVESVPARLRRDFQEALRNMQQARQIKPLQPELLCMIGEVAGLAHDFESMHDALQGGGRVLDAIDRQSIAALSLASTYHKLAHVYIKLGHNEHAVPLLQRSLQVLPTFLPSMKDYVYVHFALGDRNAAEFALEQLRLTKVGIEDSEDFRRLAGQVQQTPWL